MLCGAAAFAWVFGGPGAVASQDIDSAAGADPAVGQSSLSRTVQAVQTKMVKIYGAGGIRGLEAYQSGLIISATGHVLTASSYVLDTDRITVVLDDGREFEAVEVGADPRMELAVLKIEAEDLPYFDLSQLVEPAIGSRVLAFSNLFGVATGDEAVSVLHGWLSAKTKLSARRGAFRTPYQGPVLIVDAITNNPGAPGGALTNQQGQLIGVLGKELRQQLTNTWLNYALPVQQVAPAVQNILTDNVQPLEGDDRWRPAHPLELTMLGIVTVPDVIAKTPPYIDAVYAKSPAAAAGLKPDDLIVMIDGRSMTSVHAVQETLSLIEADAQIILTILRDNQLIEVSLGGQPNSGSAIDDSP